MPCAPSAPSGERRRCPSPRRSAASTTEASAGPPKGSRRHDDYHRASRERRRCSGERPRGVLAGDIEVVQHGSASAPSRPPSGGSQRSRPRWRPPRRPRTRRRHRRPRPRRRVRKRAASCPICAGPETTIQPRAATCLAPRAAEPMELVFAPDQRRRRDELRRDLRRRDAADVGERWPGRERRRHRRRRLEPLELGRPEVFERDPVDVLGGDGHGTGHEDLSRRPREHSRAAMFSATPRKPSSTGTTSPTSTPIPSSRRRMGRRRCPRYRSLGTRPQPARILPSNRRRRALRLRGARTRPPRASTASRATSANRVASRAAAASPCSRVNLGVAAHVGDQERADRRTTGVSPCLHGLVSESSPQ